MQALLQQAASLLLYQSVLENEVGQAFLTVLATLAASAIDEVKPVPRQVLYTYGQFFRTLVAQQLGWQNFLIQALLYADNPFTRQVQLCPLAELPPELLRAAGHDLQVLQSLWEWNGAGLVEAIQTLGGPPLPSLVGSANPESAVQTSPLAGYCCWADALPALGDYHRQFGCGDMARYRAFTWQGGQLKGQPYPDWVVMAELVGYEDQRDQVLKNTEALLRGYPALNILLYGSRGSGKSAMIKALLPLYGDRGLRLIEVSKAALLDLPLILTQLQALPQKFIIFVDDLSFEEDEESYKALKVVLEGNITARPPNVIVYATSNRRHLIREFFEDRPRPKYGDEIHAWDTVQEKLSLSDRFGLTLTFTPADQDTYLKIVFHLAQCANLSLTRDDLRFQALQWATCHNGRSGRTARQFVDFLQVELGLTTDLGEIV
ncbi:MAG: ATP-binding protein [Acaryochloris sp. RU_4_1]|nr:ATP-binding protein [Acaryochloris sp. RU_4_1]NJR55820.1 ATP-binding protein [Acaryochloris sp. CRU_2_0]